LLTGKREFCAGYPTALTKVEFSVGSRQPKLRDPAILPFLGLLK